MKLVRSAVVALLFIAVLPLSAATFTSNSPTTTNNDDSCDISLLPAATLLMPYFEVDINAAAGNGETAIFTITNTTDQPQAARVTLWTDYGYPVINFNIYLTGYDVQSINLFDIIRRGQIAPESGTGSDVSPVGRLSGTPPGQDRDNPRLNEGSCNDLPVVLPSVYITRMQQAFTQGVVPAFASFPECRNAGGVHTNAVGYATIDLVNKCDVTLPTEQNYWTDDISYDNVLIGDYLQINGAQDFAQVNPLVHIRAVPEGGNYDATAPTNLRRTFYSVFNPTGAAGSDRRQPLPSTFAARWIGGGPAFFQTDLKMWREGRTGVGAACTDYGSNALLTATEVVRFDEQENPEIFAPVFHPVIPLSARVSVGDDDVFPPATGGDIAGWMYVNLDDFDSNSISRQAWVVVSMRAEGRFSGDMDAQALGNGCSAPTATTNANGGLSPIGPAPNTTP